MADSKPFPGTVYLVGGGPGAPELLTLRAAELLRNAEVVAYDELIHPALLELTSAETELIPVGHRGHNRSQMEWRLHPEVLRRAMGGQSVVRLKTGDPLIFGRGGEEAEELTEYGIPFEIVPGVTSALGAAAYAGIPLTHRAVAASVTFTTGHTCNNSIKKSASIEESGAGTLVLFMAAQKLATLLKQLIADGRLPSTPAAYVAAASMRSRMSESVPVTIC